MKNLISILILSFLISCGDKKNDELTKLTKEKDNIVKQIDKLNTELIKVNDKINLIQKVDQTTAVSTYAVVLQPFEHAIELQSNVSTDQDVMIMPEFAGTLTWKVKEGANVSKGQVIGTINDGGMSQQLSSAKIQSELAKTAFDKQSRLWNEKIGSEIQYLQSKAQSESAQKQVAAIQAQMGRTQIKAPFSGVVDQLIMQTGQSVAPGIPLGKIINLHEMKITADVSEKYISNVKVGSVVQIELPELNQIIQSKVGRISNFINPNNRSFSIEIPVNNNNGMMKPNLSAKIKIIDYKNPNAISIPSSAIKLNAENKKYVYTLTKINGKEGVATKTFVQTGNSTSDQSEIISGLKIGDIIVKEGGNNIVEGSKVKVSGN